MLPGQDQRPAILLADDDNTLRTLFSAYLRKAGYMVVTARDGAEAVLLFRAGRGSIRLVVTDMDMPALPGIEVAKAATAAGCPVLLISGTSLPDEAAEAGWEFLPKPFSGDALVQRIDRILARPRKPRVMLAEDDMEVRRRLCGLLEPGYEVVAELAEGKGVLAKAEELRPELILLDIGMPGMNGFAVARLLHESMPFIPVLFVTQHADPVYVAEAFRSGVAGYVLKRDAVSELNTALDRVRGGSRYVSAGVRAA